MVESVLQLLVVASIYAILGISMNLLLSQVGIFSMAYGGMFGVGAYAAALALLRGWPFSAAALAAVALCAVAGALVSIPALRTSGDYFIAATFALQVIAFDLFTNLVPVTNGPAGLYGVPPPRVLGMTVQSSGRFLALAAALVALALYVAVRIRRSNFGLVLRAISEDEVAPAALGRNIYYFKVSTAITASAVIGLAGALYAAYLGYVNPSPFSLEATVLVATIVILGGIGNFAGSVLASVVLWAFPEGLRYLDLPTSLQGPLHQLLYGLLLVGIVVLRLAGQRGESGAGGA
jgi:branched-chain amino acid transport system permease protein